MDLQAELQDTVEKLYEKYVPQATREYTDDRASRTQGPRREENKKTMQKRTVINGEKRDETDKNLKD